MVERKLPPSHSQAQGEAERWRAAGVLKSPVNNHHQSGGDDMRVLAADQKCSAAAKTGRRRDCAAHNCAFL